MKRLAPNTVLPKGATMLKCKITKSIGSWVEMTYDASVVRFGITWLRVEGGFGDSGEREDWVADVPLGCMHVGDDDYNGSDFALIKHPSFDAAIKWEMERSIAHMKKKSQELHHEAQKANATVAMLTEALRRK